VSGKSEILGTRNMSKQHYPKFIRINSPQVKEQIFDNNYTRDLLCFTPVFKKNQKHHVSRI